MSDYLGRIITKNPTYPSPTAAPGVWTLDEALQYQKAGKWPPGYAISRSVRLRSSASAYFQRTPAASGNRQTYTWSGWVKRGLVAAGTYYALFTAGQVTGGDDGLFFDTTAGALYFTPDQGATSTLISSSVYRDPSAWYHIVLAVDTTQATSTNRIKIYVNGVQLTSFSTATYPAQNLNSTFMNTANIHRIGAHTNAGYYFDGYMTEINFIDGQALTPDYFGYADTATGVWQPLPYTGIYGTNGFYLNFKDPTSTTTIGYDYSGNSNNFTANNVSVTSGATYDSMVDSPSLYGTDTGVGNEVRGNYCVMNPVARNTRITIANANLQVTGDNTANHQIVYGTFPMTTGKWYWEVVVNNPTTSTVNIVGIQSYVGFADGTYCGVSGNGIGWGYTTTLGNFYSSNFTVSGSAPVLANGTIGIAYDADAGKIWFRNTSGSWVQGDPAAGTSPTGTLSGTATTMMPAVSFYNSNGAWSFNFGQQAFSYTAPTGFKALCTQNLSTPTINNGANYMAATLYTGNGATQTIANTIGSASFQPDFVWVKGRSGTTDHALYDSVRGVQKQVESNTTTAETTETTGLTAFGSTGFTVGALAQMNTNTATYVGWQWLAGAGSSSSNTDGNRTSTVSVNPTAGFSVVTWTFSTSANNTIGHGLGVAPSFIIVKDRSSAFNWDVYHVSLGYTQRLILNSTAAAAAGYFAAAPTSTVFSMTTAAYTNNDNIVAYCFAPIAGYSAFGTWTNNNSTNGTFTYLGFRPRLIILKNSDNVERWFIFDSSRQTYNVAAPATSWLVPNDTSAEGANGATTATIDLLSNGFKIYTTNPAAGEVSFGTRPYIYAAFAENPFKYARAR